MINTTDFQEFEISLPGDWLRKDNGDTYSFTVDKMEIRDERLFRQLYIRHAGDRPGGQQESIRYALNEKFSGAHDGSNQCYGSATPSRG